jgi:hypothetical protein
LGAIAAVLPSLLCGFLGLASAGMLLRWLEGWQDLTLSLFGNELARLDLIQLLELQELLKLLRVLSSASGAALFLLVLALALLSGIMIAAMVVLLGLVYNFVASATGGMVVELRTVEAPDAQE